MIQPLQPYMYFSNKSGITHRPKDYNFTSTWTVASKQYEYFSNKNNGYINGSVLKMNGDEYNDIKPFLRFFNIQKGDLMFYGYEYGIYHSTMITDVHGHYVCELNNYFSTGYETDISLTQFNSTGHSVIAYVGVPNGNVLVFDPDVDLPDGYDANYKFDQATAGRVIYTGAPFDNNPNDPTRPRY